MLLTIYLAIVFCAAITLLLISAVAFVQDKRFFSSAPKEALEVLQPRNQELFCGARAMGWVLMILSALTILGIGIIAIWDGLRNGFTFTGFFLRFVWIFTIYKAYDMIFFDWFLLCRFRFFQHYYPEVAPVYGGMGLYAVLRGMVMTRKEQIESSGNAMVPELFSLCDEKNMLTRCQRVRIMHMLTQCQNKWKC